MSTSKFLKNLPHNRAIVYCVSWLAHLYIWFVYATSKKILRGNLDAITTHLKQRKGLAIFTWHGRTLLAPLVMRNVYRDILEKEQKICMLTSPHADGQVVKTIAHTFGVEGIDGSSINMDKTHNSFAAIKNIMNSLKNGDIITFAGDGSRPPAFQMNTHITEIVEKMGSGIIFGIASYKRKIQLPNWDKYQIALPFNTIIFEFGDLFSKKSDEEEMVKQMNDTMAKNDGELS
jgi:lysophospholipid acyltransferase (LPLAT)-like uncharacterized protein